MLNAMQLLLPTLAILGSYLVGAIPFGYLVARARGIDILARGSGNIGATNVSRVLGRRFGLLVFALDFAKGTLPVALVLLLTDANGWLVVAAGLAAFLGHLYPLYLRFRGGKGVATGAGVVAVLLPGPALVGLGVWLVVALASRYVSLASLLAAGALCLSRLAQTWPADAADPRTAFSLLAVVLVVVRHRANIGRLWRGQESQLREHAMMPALVKSLHVLAVGLWFGAAVFFTFVVGLSLFASFEALGSADERPAWFPKPALYAANTETLDGPKEQGSRAAGYAVGPLFDAYFLLQGVCGFVALVTALAWRSRGCVHRWRANLLLVAVALVLIGWPLARHVSALRGPRNEATDAYLRGDLPREPMQAARAEFAQWHLASVFLNLLTVLVVASATVLAAHLPTDEPRSPST